MDEAEFERRCRDISDLMGRAAKAIDNGWMPDERAERAILGLHDHLLKLMRQWLIIVISMKR